MSGPRRYDVGHAAKIFAGLALLLFAIGIAIGTYFATGIGRGSMFGVLLAGPAIAATVVAGLSHLLTKSAIASWTLSVLVLLLGALGVWWVIWNALLSIAE